MNKVEGLGRQAAIEGDRNDGSEILKIWFVNADEFQQKKLLTILAEHLKGFRKTFGEDEQKGAG